MLNKSVTIKNARLIFKNFAGEERKFNPQGKRNFCVFLDIDAANDLEARGWNIKWLTPRNEDEESQPYIKINVNYKHKPPKIVTVTSKGQTILDEDTVNILDWADIDKVDLIFTPFETTMMGKDVVSAYIKSMYVTLVEDELELAYYAVPNSPEYCVGEDCMNDQCIGKDCQCKHN